MAAGRLRRRDFTLLARLALGLSFLHNLNHFQFPLLRPFLFARIFAQTPIPFLDFPLHVLFFWKLTAGSEERETNAAGGAVHAHDIRMKSNALFPITQRSTQYLPDQFRTHSEPRQLTAHRQNPLDNSSQLTP